MIQVHDKFERALLHMIKGTLNKDKTLQIDAAYSLETIVRNSLVPKRLEFLLTLFSALSYDLADEIHDARRQYTELLKKDPLDLTNIIGSEVHSKQLCDAIIHLGL